jgi:hypothetical protein
MMSVVVIERGFYLYLYNLQYIPEIKKCFFYVLLIMALVSPAALARELPGAGGAAGAGVSYPVEIGTAGSVRWNPAELGFNDHTIQVEFTPAALELVSKDANLLPAFTAFFNDEREKAIEQIKNSTVSEFLTASFRSHHNVQVALGKYGFSFGAKLFGEAAITEDILDLLVSEPELGREYLVKDFKLDLAGYFDVGVSAAVPIIKNRLYAGLTGKFLWGWRYGSATVEGEVLDIENEIPLAKMISAKDGKGYSFDIGLAWKITEHSFIDISLLNVGKIIWLSPEESTYTYQSTPDGYQLELVSSQPLDENVSWYTPQTLRLGMVIQANPKVKWGGDVSYVLSGPKTGELMVSLGAETTALSKMPFRVGVQYSNKIDELIFSAGFGIHLGPLTIDVGIPNFNVLSGDGNLIGISLTTGLRF